VNVLAGAFGPVAAGDPVTGHFIYDPGQTPFQSGPNFANWLFTSTPNTFDVTIHGLTFSADPSLEFFAVVIDDAQIPPFPGNPGPLFEDVFQLLGQASANTWPGSLPFPGSASLLILQGKESTTLPIDLFTGTNLPTSFNAANGTFFGQISAIDPVASTFSLIGFSVDQVTGTPEPGTVATLAFGLIAGVFTFRRRRR
jgi:hypothetical protein